MLRMKVCSELRINTSISPDCSTEKRTFEVVPMYFTLLGRSQDGVGDGAAIGDVESLPFALGILECVAWNSGVDATDELATLLHSVQRDALHLALCGGGCGERQQAGKSGAARGDAGAKP